jgi:hypothetical protein
MKLVDLPLNTALPKDRARSACTAALRTQVALRLSRFDLEVFFLGAAIISTRVFEHSLSFYLPIALDASKTVVLQQLKALPITESAFDLIVNPSDFKLLVMNQKRTNKLVYLSF